MKEAKLREKQILQKIKEEERETYAEIGKKAIELFNGKMSEDDFKILLIKNCFLEKVEDENENENYNIVKTEKDFSSEKADNLNTGTNNEL